LAAGQVAVVALDLDLALRREARAEECRRNGLGQRGLGDEEKRLGRLAHDA
jgi:hypothetical protein